MTIFGKEGKGREGRSATLVLTGQTWQRTGSPLPKPTPQAVRDVQKNSKNAVYSVHRGDFDKAKALLDAAK